MQEYGGGVSFRNSDFGRERGSHHADSNLFSAHQLSAMQPKSYGCSNEALEPNTVSYSRAAGSSCEVTVPTQQFHNQKYNFYDPLNSRPNMDDKSMDRRSQSSWSISSQEPIGTGAKKKIVKSQEKRNAYSADQRYLHERFKDSDTDRQRKDKNLKSDSTSSLNFYAEGERMVSELCNVPDANSKGENNKQTKTKQDDDKTKCTSSDVLLIALDKIVIHDQIPNQIVQLAVEACTDAENIAIAHHNRPCFKNIHSICAKTRSNVQKPDSAVPNLHSQGIPWVIKNFIFSFVRILDGWKGVKELLCEKHDNFSRIENKYYSPNIRECFVQWQAVTKEMLTHIYKTFKCLDQGFTMEQKSFTHNYYATNSAAPRHQNQNKFQPSKSHLGTPRPVNTSQQFNAVQPPWLQNTSNSNHGCNEAPWPPRSNIPCKKYPVSTPPTNNQVFYNVHEQYDIDNYQKAQYKCDVYNYRETKPRQSWTITNVPDFRALENMCHADQRELYNQLKQKMEAELDKAPGQPLMTNMTCDLLQRREMELKSKMIPLSHVEKSLIPNMSTADIHGCYIQKNNSCGDSKEEADFFATWGQMVQKEHEFVTHHTHNIQTPNVVTYSNISGPTQFVDVDNDEYHEISKVYMKPGSYKVPIKTADINQQLNAPQDLVCENPIVDELGAPKLKSLFSPVTLAPQPKCSLESWPCMSRKIDDLFPNDPGMMSRPPLSCFDMNGASALEILSSLTSDNAWEAAKQSAPKLMDFLHDGSKSDTARLYDALGLTEGDGRLDDLKQFKMNVCQNSWPPDVSAANFQTEVQKLWDDQNMSDSLFSQDVKLNDMNRKSPELDIQSENECKIDDSMDTVSTNFDKTGNCTKEVKKKIGKTGNPGDWYNPKKKKPLPASTIKIFENILSNMSKISEANFIHHDMDIKVAPRFYEVVKHPMCLHDIATKLKNNSYCDYEQVVQDFRRIFNNVRLYLKSYPDAVMKKNVKKVSAEFEKMLQDANPKSLKKCEESSDKNAVGEEVKNAKDNEARISKTDDKK